MTLKERLYRFRSFWIFPIIAAVLLNLTLRAEPQNRRTDLLLLFAIGILLWTVLEYGLHRFDVVLGVARSVGFDWLAGRSEIQFLFYQH